MALHIEERDLLALRQREVPPGKRLCRRSEHRWWHAARLSEQLVPQLVTLLRCSTPWQLLAKIHPVHRAPQQPAVPAIAAATGLIASFQRSSQPPKLGCRDDRLNPPPMMDSMWRSGISMTRVERDGCVSAGLEVGTSAVIKEERHRLYAMTRAKMISVSPCCKMC
jgi:hypothetical protein